MVLPSWAWRVEQDGYAWGTVVIADTPEAAIALIEMQKEHPINRITRLFPICAIEDALIEEASGR